MTEIQKNLLKEHNLNPDHWKVVWDDYDTLEVLNRRGRRHVIRKKRIKGGRYN